MKTVIFIPEGCVACWDKSHLAKVDICISVKIEENLQASSLTELELHVSLQDFYV